MEWTLNLRQLSRRHGCSSASDHRLCHRFPSELCKGGRTGRGQESGPIEKKTLPSSRKGEQSLVLSSARGPQRCMPLRTTS